jgi:hypothetical protein
MTEAEELFGMLAQLLSDKRTKIDLRIVCDRSGGDPDHGKASNRKTRANKRS